MGAPVHRLRVSPSAARRCLGLAQDARDLGAAHGADALSEPATVGLLDVSSELALLLALHAVRLTGVFLGHWGPPLAVLPLSRSVAGTT